MKATIRNSLFLAISLLAIGAQAQQAKQYSVSDFFKNSDFAALRFRRTASGWRRSDPTRGAATCLPCVCRTGRLRGSRA